MSADPRGWRMDPGRQLGECLTRRKERTCSESVAVNDRDGRCIGISNIDDKSSRFSSCEPVHQSHYTQEDTQMRTYAEVTP